MIATDREWLRFVSFAVLVGGVLGAAYTGALAMRGHTLWWAIAGGVIATGGMAAIVHVALRYTLDAATDPSPSTDADPTDADTDPEADT